MVQDLRAFILFSDCHCRHKLGWADGSLSDCIAILNAYKTWLNKRETGAFKRSGAGGEVGYGRQYYLQIRRLKEVQKMF